MVRRRPAVTRRLSCHRIGDRVRDLRRIFVLPEAEHDPSRTFKRRPLFGVALDIARDLGAPVLDRWRWFDVARARDNRATSSHR